MKKPFYSLRAGALVAALSLPMSAPAHAIEERSRQYVFSGARWQVSVDARSGAIVSSRGASARAALWKSGANGLWHARLRPESGPETLVKAAEVAPDQIERALSPDRKTLTIKYLHPQISVEVRLFERADGVDASATVTPTGDALIEFALPSRLRALNEGLLRLITPAHTHDAPGLALKSAFFAPQGALNPSGWRVENVGPSAFQSLFGALPEQRAMDEAPIALRVTEEGRKYLGEDAAQVLGEVKARVVRPLPREKADIVLLDSANGPYFSGTRLGEAGGALWRIGGAVEWTGNAWAAELVSRAVGAVAGEAPETRRKIALLALKRGPQRTNFAGVSADEWRAALRRLPGVVSKQVVLEEIADLAALRRVLAGNEHTAVLNPYGEALPVGDGQAPVDAAQEIARWVRGGGHWFETGGFSFFAALRPEKYFSYGGPYPGTFAHFFQLESSGATMALYAVQPQRETGWKALEALEAKNPAQVLANVLVPSAWSVGGEDGGAYLDAAFTPWIAAGQAWTTPVSRLVFGGSALQNAQRHAQENAITRTLSQKMAPQALAKLKNSVLLFYAGDARSKLAHLERVPSPSLLHFSDYLKGGFDKEYPDHLPPNAAFGTAAELKAFFDAARAQGHLISPYTNPTWWPDNPPGPTFARAGRAPLQVNADKSNTREQYNDDGGWTITLWHASVREANRKLREEFTRQFPVDVLFQDQVGARSPRFDFNAASPVPHAYMAGLLAQAQEDSQIVPLSTENGWDHLANWESQFCGFTFSTVPTENAPEWRTFMRDRFPRDSFEFFPLAQAMAHDKLAFAHHDLGQFVTNREVLAWTLALGFNMSCRTEASALAQDGPREWLKYLQRVQRSVAARYVGQGVRSWEYLDRDTIAARYGEVLVTSNLNPQKIRFRAESPRVLASDTGTGAPFISQARSDGRFDVWFYGAPGENARLELPPNSPKSRRAALLFDGQKAPRTLNFGQKAPPQVLLPARDAGRVLVPEALKGAPSQWKLAQKPKLGLIDLGTVGHAWSSITPAQWKAMLEASSLAREHGLEVEVLSQPSQVLAALKSGPTGYFAIVNAHTEAFPSPGPKRWAEMLAAIQGYVAGGGHWWETGGYSFTSSVWRGGSAMTIEPIGPAGAAFFGIGVGSGAVEAPAQPLKVGEEGASWLSSELQERIVASQSAVNRGLPIGGEDPGHISLVRGESGTFIGGYRLNGWGGLWRVGGFNPNPEVVLPTVREALEFLWMNPSSPVKNATKYLWHAVLTPEKAPAKASR
jgi:hypothetical protein